MRLCVLQLAATWGERDRALARVDALLARGPCDLALLGEAALTGYVSADLDFDLTRFSEPADGPTAQGLAALARKHRTTLVGPLIWHHSEPHASYLHNAMIAFDPEGARTFLYAKRHPWFCESWASAGKEPMPRVVIDGRKVTLAICFDVHFLEEECADTLAWADLLLFPSAWVDDDDTRIPMLCALARRHHLWIAGANWAPGVVEVHGQGHSCVINPKGDVVAELSMHEDRLDTALEPVI